MSREEELKRRYELEDELKNILVKSSALSNRLGEISKELSGIDSKIELLNQKKSDIPPQHRYSKIKIYTYIGIALLIIAIIDFLMLCNSSLNKYKLFFTVLLIILICIGLWCGYAYWSNSQKLKYDIELDNEIEQIKKDTNGLFNNRTNIQDDLEKLVFTMSQIIIELKQLTKIK